MEGKRHEKNQGHLPDLLWPHLIFNDLDATLLGGDDQRRGGAALARHLTTPWVTAGVHRPEEGVLCSHVHRQGTARTLAGHACLGRFWVYQLISGLVGGSIY